MEPGIREHALPIHPDVIVFSLQRELLVLAGQLQAEHAGAIGIQIAGVDEARDIDPQLRAIPQSDRGRGRAADIGS